MGLTAKFPAIAAMFPAIMAIMSFTFLAAVILGMF
jgi:hypothetical protein